MATLENKAFANKSIITARGKIQFNSDGRAEVEDSWAEKLATMKGFSIISSEEDFNDENSVEEDSIEEEVIEEDKTPENDDYDTEEEYSDEEQEIKITKSALESMTVKQLEKYAKEEGISLDGITKKADIIEAIMNS